MHAQIIKLKEALALKRMLSSDEVITLTGHPIGGVCPLAGSSAGGVFAIFH